VIHFHFDYGDQPFVYADCGEGWTLSVCAPRSMSKEAVEQFANASGRLKGPAVVINKAEFGLGIATPNPCDDKSVDRQHWFLITKEMLERLR
jgi:hypothetical protein